MADPLLRIDNLIKRFGGLVATDKLSMQVVPGELHAIIGPNGAGKTTLISQLTGQLVPDSGAIHFAGRDITGLRPNQRNVGMVFQSYALFPNMTVADNVAFGLKIARKPANEIKARVEEMLKLIKLPQLGERFPYQLSGGQQQRVALARTLVYQPELLLLDEPLSNQDAKLRDRARAWLAELRHRLKLTTIYVTHDQNEALALSDRVVVMNGGNIAQIGTPQEIYEDPADLVLDDWR